MTVGSTLLTDFELRRIGANGFVELTEARDARISRRIPAYRRG